jgi:RNA polymerase sigma-70 factor (ECF subfamily)
LHDDEAQLIQSAREGDHDAFHELIRRYQGPLFGVLVRLVGDPGLAEELAQEAFVRAYRSLPGFREEARFGTWLVQIGIHAARDHRRRARRRANVVSLEELRDAGRLEGDPADLRPEADPQAALEGREAGRILGEALLRLPEQYREVLALKHFQGWSYEEIARLTGDTVGTLKVRAHRARHLVRQEMEGLGWDAGEQPRRTEGPSTGPMEAHYG